MRILWILLVTFTFLLTFLEDVKCRRGGYRSYRSSRSRYEYRSRPSTNHNSGNSGNTGLIVGIVVGSVILVAVIVAVIFIFCYRTGKVTTIGG